MGIPICAVTGHVAGHPDACGDCDPCYSAASVSAPVQRLIAEIIDLRNACAELSASLDEPEIEECPICGRDDDHSHTIA